MIASKIYHRHTVKHYFQHRIQRPGGEGARNKKHEIYIAAFGGHHFYDLFVQSWGGGMAPSAPPLPPGSTTDFFLYLIFVLKKDTTCEHYHHYANNFNASHSDSENTGKVADIQDSYTFNEHTCSTGRLAQLVRASC